MERTKHRSIGNIVAPPRFLLFVAATAAATWCAVPLLGTRFGVMAGFDAGALVFLLSCLPLLGHEAEGMRLLACRNDGNRWMLLLVTVVVMLAILASIISVLRSDEASQPRALPLIIGTLILCWCFSNAIYTLHYAHLFYKEARSGGDTGGLQFPETPEPDYWDFIYFAFCLGMTFQTSDVTVTSRQMRRVVTAHSLSAFVFNLGVLAFAINALGGR